MPICRAAAAAAAAYVLSAFVAVNGEETWSYLFDKLDNGGTSVASTGNNTGQLNATVHKGASLGAGKVAGTTALQLDGVGKAPDDGQHVSIDGGITVGGGAFTACAWTKWDTFGHNSRVIDIGNGQSSDNIYLCNVRTTNTLDWGIIHGKTGKHVSIRNILQPNKWTYVCGTVSATGYMAVLLNGVEQKCTSGTACDTSTGNGSNGWTPNRLLRSNAYMGRSNWDGDAYFAGSISDVTLIDGKAVTEAEAVAMMLVVPFTWTYPLNVLPITSTGANTGQLNATVHAGASLGAGRVEGMKAIQLNGVGRTPADGQHVSIDGGITVGGSAFTACAWTKWDKFGHQSRVIDFGNGPMRDNIYLTNYGTTNNLGWEIWRGNTKKYVYIGNSLQRNTWIHVCGTVSASGYMAVLLNGVEQKCTGGNACDISTGKVRKGWTPNRLLRSNAYIGRSNWNTDAYFAGSISDVTLIDGKAVTEAEAVAMMLVVPFTWTYPLNVLPITSTGVNTGQKNATVHEGASIGDGRVGGTKAIQLDGVGMTPDDGQHVTIDGGITVGGSAFTACAWTKWDKFGYYSKVIDIGNGPGRDNILLGNVGTTNTLEWYIIQNSYKGVHIGNITLQPNTWTHICGTVSASGTMAVLLNGVEQKCTGGSACDTSTGMGSTGHTPIRLLRSNAYIGRSNWNSNAYFNGSISDVTLIDGKAVTEAEAVAMMLPFLFTWTYPLNVLPITSTGENTGQLNATVHAGASLGDGRVEGTMAIQLDGVGKTPDEGQHVSIDGGITVGGSAFTACAWTKWDKFGHFSRVIDIGNSPDNDNIILNNVAATNTLQWNIFRGNNQKAVIIRNILQLNTWTHVCGTVSASGYMAMLLNGVEQKCTGGGACDTSTGKGSKGWTPIRLPRSNAYMGRSPFNNNAYFAGSISDVTLIDGKAATEAEAVAMMRATDPTTSTISTTTTTGTIRSKVNVAVKYCNGKEDPTDCSEIKTTQCGTTFVGNNISATCPILCNTCSGSIMSATATTTPTNLDSDADKKQSSMTPTIVGIIVGVLVVLIAGIVIFFCCKKRQTVLEVEDNAFPMIENPMLVANRHVIDIVENPLWGPHAAAARAGATVPPSLPSPPPISDAVWDQRAAASEATWNALLNGKVSGTFVIRASKHASVVVDSMENTIASISIVGAGGSKRHEQRIVQLASNGYVKLANSKHAHASLEALVAYYQNPMYFAQPDGKPDVPMRLIIPSINSSSGGGSGDGGIDLGSDQVDYDVPYWRSKQSGGAAAGLSLAADDVVYDDISTGTEAEQHIFHRAVDNVNESEYATVSPLNPLDRLPLTPVLPFLKAAAIANKDCNDDIVAFGRRALTFARKHAHCNTVQRPGGAKLTADDIAVLYLYTMQSDFYSRLNEELGGYGKAAENTSEFDAEYFLPIVKLLVNALDKLPAKCVKLFRGVKLLHNVFLKNVDGGEVAVGDEVMFKQVTSCSPLANVLKHSEFLGTKSAGTSFQIIAVTGHDLSEYSAVPGEAEVVLPPGSRFRVDSITPWMHGVTEIRLRQIVRSPRAGASLDARGSGSGGSAAEAAVLPDASVTYENVSVYMQPSGVGDSSV